MLTFVRHFRYNTGMKTIIERKGIFAVLLSAALIPTAATSQASVYAWRGELAFAPLPAGDVRAAGWLRAKLELVRDGMGGNLDRLDPPQFAYPFVRRDFEANVGGKGYIDWCAEMSGEYWLGLVELAYALGDEALLKKAGDWVEGVLALQEPDGYMGAYRPNENRLEDYNAWSCHFAYRALLVAYSATGDKRILDALERGCLWFARNWAGDKKTGYVGATILSPACRVATLTGNREILSFCEDFAAYLEKNSQRGRPGSAYGSAPGGFDTFDLHAGGYHLAALGVRMAQPLALAAAGGRSNALERIEKSLSLLDKVSGVQPTGAYPGDHEHLARASCLSESEYCATIFFEELFQWLLASSGKAQYADRIERLVYNAGEGARKKDERAMTYLSSPNSLRATLDSSRWGPDPCYGVYAPNVNAACCAANSIRLYPQMLAFAVLSGADGSLTISHYLPFSARRRTSDGTEMKIEAETTYPFDGLATFRIKCDRPWKGVVRLRRPGFADGMNVARNGKPVPAEVDANGWVNIAGVWNNDVLTVDFDFRPKLIKVKDRDFQEPWRAVTMGPLLFAQHVKEKWTKCPQKKNCAILPPDWSWFGVECEEDPPRYAIVPDAEGRMAKVVHPMTSDPWSSPPIGVMVPVKRASAAYPDGYSRLRHTPWPAAAKVRADLGAKEEMVEFVPFGCTALRLSCFPEAAE